MGYYIGIEDLVANALIESMKIDDSIKFLTYSEIEKYGAKVIEIIKNEKKEAVLILSRSDTNRMLSAFSDAFVEKEINGKRGIELSDGISVLDLVDRFRGYLPLYVLLAFMEAKDTLSVSLSNRES